MACARRRGERRAFSQERPTPYQSPRYRTVSLFISQLYNNWLHLMDLILSEGGDGCLIQCKTDFETENFLSPPMTVNNSLSNEKMVGGLPRIGRFLLRNLACSALVPGPAAGHQCATALSPLSDSFPAKWLSTQKILLMVGVARFVIPKEFIYVSYSK